jgi:hypothetical protein
MVIKYIKILHFKAVQNVPKSGGYGDIFLLLNYGLN